MFPPKTACKLVASFSAAPLALADLHLHRERREGPVETMGPPQHHAEGLQYPGHGAEGRIWLIWWLVDAMKITIFGNPTIQL